MELRHDVTAIEIANQLYFIRHIEYFKPNGKEYVCKLCHKLEFSLPHIQHHILEEHKIGDIQ